jgi:hypothetical protein
MCGTIPYLLSFTYVPFFILHSFVGSWNSKHSYLPATQQLFLTFLQTMGQIFSSSGGRDDDDEVNPARPTKKAKTEHVNSNDTPNFGNDHLPKELMHADDAVEDDEKPESSSSTSPPHCFFLSVTSAGLWENIESFLPLHDTLSVAQTCKSLHQLIIDQDTHQVKVSHFTSIRSHRLLMLALQRIHFQSLKRLHYPPVWRSSKRSREIRLAMITAFPIFVAKLSQARNIQHLTLRDLDHIVEAEYNGENIYELLHAFSINLQTTCTKLKELDVDLCGVVDDRQFYSVFLMRALTPTILQRKDEIERLSLKIMEKPADEYLDEERELYVQVATEFFEAVLSTRRKLKFLNIWITDSPCLNLLLDVAGEHLKAGDIINRPDLEHLELHLRMSYDRQEMISPFYSPPDDMSLVVPLMEDLSSCPSISITNLSVPREFWAEKKSGYTLAKLIKKGNLKTLNLDFFDDRDQWSNDFDGDKVVLSLIDFGLFCKNNHSCIEEVFLSSLMNIKATHLYRFAQLLDNIGLQIAAMSCGVISTSISDEPENRLFPSRKIERWIGNPDAMAELERCTGDDRVEVLHANFRTVGAQERWKKAFEHECQSRRTLEEHSSGSEEDDSSGLESDDSSY